MHMNRQKLLLILPFFLLSAASLAAQSDDDQDFRSTRSSSRDRKEKDNFASRLWYGGSINLGFNAFNDPFFGSGSVFVFGLSPMVGYKIVGPLSAGPRMAFTFVSEKYSGAKAVGLFNVEAGVFLRSKIFRGVFAQGEISNEWLQYADVYNQVGNKIPKINRQRVNQYLGLGYNSAVDGSGGFEFLIMYNFALANNIYTNEQPLEYRAGFTWRF